MSSADMLTFSAWSLLSLTVTAHGAPMYPDELEVRYVWDATVPNGRYISPAGLRSWIEDGLARPACGVSSSGWGAPGPRTRRSWSAGPCRTGRPALILPVRMFPNSQTQLPWTLAWVQNG